MSINLSSWQRTAVLLALGGLTGWVQAPLNWWWVPFLTFPAFLHLLKPLQGWAAFRASWTFAFGYYLFGLYWIAHAMMVDIRAFWWAMPLAVAGLPMLLAFFQGAAGWATQRWGGAGLARLIFFAVMWCAADWLRGHVLTGFPWLLLGQLWTDVEWARQLASLGGAYLLTLWAVMLAVLPAAPKGERIKAALIAVALLGGAFTYGSVPLSDDDGETLTVRLVQPNIDQAMKLDAQAKEDMLRRTLALTQHPGKVDAVIWPESAAPYRLEDRADIRQIMGQALPEGSLLLTGVVRREAGQYYNSLTVLDGQGKILDSYDKAHLVPFGEYIPFHKYLPFDPVTGSSDFSAGIGSRTLSVGMLPPFSAMICYEALFPGEVANRRVAPQWLVNVTNDGWYGMTHGPYQHLDIARLRAVEEGVPLVRSANTGISAAIDARGGIVAMLPLGASGVLDVTLHLIQLPTPYKIWGDWLFSGLLLLLVLIVYRRMPDSTGGIA